MENIKKPTDFGMMDNINSPCFNYDCKGANNCEGCPIALGYNISKLTEIIKYK